MEERISTAESRGAASGFLFQGFLNALQQRNAKSPQSHAKAEQVSSTSDLLPACPASDTQQNDLNEAETWKGSLSTTRKKISQTWEQYSPTLKDKVNRYSPSPLRKLKTLFTLTEERDPSQCDAVDMEGGLVEGYISSGGKKAMPDDDEGDDELDNIQERINGSSQTEKVPSGASTEMECDNCLLSLVETGQSKPLTDRHSPPYIILEEADSNGNRVQEIDDVTSGRVHPRKSPLTVQEWVDQLPLKPKINEKDCNNSLGSKDLDNQCTSEGVTEQFPHEDKKSLMAQRLSREASVQSSSSLDSILDSRRPDPVEVLLNLGFGGVPGVDMNNCRIPKRFLVPSKCKGGDWNEFLKRELLQAQNFECASLGFRGLSGPSYRRPSAIVANIMEKLRERTTPRHPVKSRFSSVAKRVLNEKSVLNKLVPSSSQSVLSPDSRKFLDNQGKISPEVPRRRIIFGQKSFAFGNDGEFIEVGSVSSTSKIADSSKDSHASLEDDSTGESDIEENKMNPATIPSPEIMLKLRRSSLQRQKRVEEEPEAVDENVVELRTMTRNPEEKYSTAKKTKGDKVIPTRFVSASGLRPVVTEEKSKTTEDIKLELKEEMKSLSEKIQTASSVELSSILLQMKELRTRLENSS